MKSVLKNLLVFTIITLSLLGSVVNAQTPVPSAPSSSATAVKPVDESTVIFPNCRLSNLLVQGDKTASGTPLDASKAKTETNIDPAKKSGYVQGCIQDIIRFIIVIASLAAILKIAASGLALLDPTGSKIGSKLSSTKTIQNLVIGLFLLIVGWNLIPILNASFNNINFLNLPGIEHCNVTNACVTEENKKATAYKLKLDDYLKSQKDGRYGGTEANKKEVVDTIKEFCANKEKKEYEAAIKKENLTAKSYTDICNNVALVETNMDAWLKKERDDLGKKGDTGSNEDKSAIEFSTALKGYRTKYNSNSADAELKALLTVMTSQCEAENIKAQKSTSDITKQFIADCKLFNDPKTQNALIQKKP